MATIFCRLLIHDFPNDIIKEFLHLITQKRFEHVTDFVAQQPVSMDSASSEKDTEVQFSFKLAGAPKSNKSERYHLLCLALCELTQEFDNLQKYFFDQKLLGSNSATVTMTILSKDIYPKFFVLQNVFCMDKLLFGSIVNRRCFNPTYYLNAPKNVGGEHEVFVQYLEEQLNLKDIDSNMLISFEHDRECFTVHFPDIMKNWVPKGDNYRSPNRVVDVRVPYSAIRRMIVSMEATDNNEMKVIFTFQVSYPPSVLVHEMIGEGMKKNVTKFKPAYRFLTWNKGHDIAGAISHASCFVADYRVTDARELLDCLDRLRKSTNSAIEFLFLYREKVKNFNSYDRNPFMPLHDLPEKYLKLKEQKYFPLVFAVQALVSRGGELYDQFFRPGYSKFYKFLDIVIERYDADLIANHGARITKTVAALENMLLELDKLKDAFEPLKFFSKCYDEPCYNTLTGLTDELAREGYMRVRKIIVTPTRKLFINPELIMGNRSLRKQGADNMLRIVFRDDDNNKVSNLPEQLINKTVLETLLNPLKVGFRDFAYLCSSSSQLRDHGCYYLAGTDKQVAEFRDSCGRFKAECIPKMMSRIGQCFTQARQLGTTIHRGSYSEIFDYIGGTDSKGKPYIFSDGCGMISREFARKIVSDMKLGNCLPSCFQIRFRGYKGVVAVNSFMDEIRVWAEKNPKFKKKLEQNICPSNKIKALPWYNQSLIFRPSQKKFHGPRNEPVEIVKISTPIPVALNKPLINILDQVSEMHGNVSHERICDRIFELLENHIENSMATLVDESRAFLTLKEFPQLILYDQLRNFNVTEEPFFRSLLCSAASVGMNRLVDKMHIHIPTAQGRMMFGIVDETGLLQYGQVFIQYTANAALKYPSQRADTIVLIGPVMITKNPSVVAGDVRMFEAVDLPCLYDLVDVVVFPQGGPRPHPDEMAGSDLDGDEYSIFWDPQLFLERNEPAFDFTSTARKFVEEKRDGTDLTFLMVHFFKDYVSQDSIGTIANAHLANSDLYGINSKICQNIALKHNQAVDFSKSGQVPKALTKEWNEGLPPEKVERFPNFMCKGHESSYKSNRLLGSLYNRTVEVQEILRIEDICAVDVKVKLDESVLMPGDAFFVNGAQSAYNEYCTLIGSICETYGIANEGQLFSSKFTNLKKRIAEKDDNNMCLFNTQHMIEEQVATIYAKFRSKFFDEFGGIEKNAELDERKFNGIRDTFRRICVSPSDKMRQKASAYYRVAYNNGKFLSFAWLVSDVLSYNRKQCLLQKRNFINSLCPLTDNLSTYINEICQSYKFNNEFNEFCEALETSYNTKKSSALVSYFVAKMCFKFIGLPKLLFVFRKWLEKQGIGNEFENESHIKPKFMDAVVVLYGLGELKRGAGGWLTNTDANVNNPVNLEEQYGGIGGKFWNLIRLFMTRSFGFSERISLQPVTERFLEPSQCLALYFAAESTFYSLAVNRRFDCLPGASDDRNGIQKVIEGNVFIVDIPRNSENYTDLFGILARKCGCKYLVVRRKPDLMNPKSFRVALKPVGNFFSIRKFRNLLTVTPCMTEEDLQKRCDMIAEEIYKKLLFYTKDGRSIDDVYVP